MEAIGGIFSDFQSAGGYFGDVGRRRAGGMDWPDGRIGKSNER
jgi:hypothetical protein